MATTLSSSSYPSLSPQLQNTRNVVHLPLDVVMSTPSDDYEALLPEMSADSVMSPAQRYTLVSFLTSISVVGTIGNGIVLWVFWARRERVVATLFIVVLATLDLMTSLVVVPFTVFMEIKEFEVGSGLDAVCKLYWFLQTFNIPFSAFIMVAIAVDRYMCICRPFLRVLTVYRAKVVVIVLGLSTAVIGVFVALMYGVHSSLPTGGIGDHFPTYDLERSSTPIVSVHNAGSGSQVDLYLMTPKSFIYSNVESDDINGESAILLRKLTMTPSTEALTVQATIGGEETDSPYWSAYSSFEIDGSIDLGICHPNFILLSTDFMRNFRIFYNCLFLACLLTIIVLYTLIYRSVLALRKRRQRRKCVVSKCPPRVATVVSTRPDTQALMAESAARSGNLSSPQCAEENANAEEEGGEVEEELEPPPPENRTGNDTFQVIALGDITSPTINEIEITLETATIVVERRSRFHQLLHQLRKKAASVTAEFPGVNSGDLQTLREKYRLANLKTASMLFVVTVIFVATYVPAFLMTVELLPYLPVVYYMYFINNVANPFIYSFMNQKFRDAMRPLICARSRSTTAIGRPAVATPGGPSKRSERHRVVAAVNTARSRDFALHSSPVNM